MIYQRPVRVDIQLTKACISQRNDAMLREKVADNQPYFYTAAISQDIEE